MWGIYRGNLDGRLQRYREKQRMFFAFLFFFLLRISAEWDQKKKVIGLCIFVVFSTSSCV